MDKRIHIPGKKLQKLKPGQQAVVRLSPEAYDELIDIANESSLPVGKVASLIIMQAKDLIVFDREEEEETK